MYIFAPNAAVEKYPYSISELRRDNPQTSFPAKPTDALLAEYGVFPVIMTERPEYDRITHDLSEGTPKLVEGIWSQTWVLTAVSEAVVAERTAEVAAQVQRDRDQRLQETDWVIIKATETGAPASPEWISYRQALRDITAQAGFPYSVEWPTKP